MPPTATPARRWPRSGGYDVLVVDRMLPKRDGLSIVEELRGRRRPHAGADPLRARRGRRPGRRPARRRRRLSRQALCLLRTARPRRGARPPPQARRGRDRLPRRRPRARPARPHRRPRRPADPAAAARVPPARIPDEACRPGGDPHHAARERLGLSLRSADQRHRRPHLAAARQDRQGLRRAAAAHRARRRIHDP